MGILYIIKPGSKFDFVGKRYLWLGFSSLLIIASIVGLFTKGLNFGIDFDGGAEVQIRIPNTWQIAKLRSELESSGIKDARVQELGDEGSGEYLIRTAGDESTLGDVSNQVKTVLSKSFKEGDEFEILKSDVVGAAAGSVLRQQGALAMLYALLVILVYVMLRFDSRFAPGAILALFHDAIVILGIYVVTGKQFDLTILAAILALIGYSNNDTIIVFDRVRETQDLFPNLSIEETVNKAVNETLGRTIMTSITTFLVVGAIFVMGGSVIHNFAFTLLCGVVIGTYSSVFIASSLIIEFTKYRDRKHPRNAAKKKKKKTFSVRENPSSL